MKIFEAHGWRWGGRWHSIKDYPHVQKTFDLTWRQMFDKYAAEILCRKPCI